MDTFKKELDHLVEIGVLSPQGMSAWASPTFIIAKKDGRVRWVSDLCKLNEVVVRRQYPLPVIKDILKKKWDTHTFQSLMYQCSTTRLNWMMNRKIYAQLQHHMAYTNTIGCQWVLNVLQTLLKNVWSKYFEISKRR